MSPEEILTNAMKAHAPLLAAVPADRIYPDFVREGRPMPSIAYARTGTTYFHTIHAPSQDGIATFEVHAMADSRTQALQTGDLFAAAMSAAGVYAQNRTAEFYADDEIWSSVFLVTVRFP